MFKRGFDTHAFVALLVFLVFSIALFQLPKENPGITGSAIGDAPVLASSNVKFCLGKKSGVSCLDVNSRQSTCDGLGKCNCKSICGPCGGGTDGCGNSCRIKLGAVCAASDGTLGECRTNGQCVSSASRPITPVSPPGTPVSQPLPLTSASRPSFQNTINSQIRPDLSFCPVGKSKSSYLMDSRLNQLFTKVKVLEKISNPELRKSEVSRELEKLPTALAVAGSVLLAKELTGVDEAEIRARLTSLLIPFAPTGTKIGSDLRQIRITLPIKDCPITVGYSFSGSDRKIEVGFSYTFGGSKKK